MSDSDTLLNSREAGKLLGVNSARVCNYAKQGDLAFVSKTPKEGYRFSMAAVERFIELKSHGEADGKVARVSEEVLAKEMGEKVLARFGVSALDKAYTPVARWVHDKVSNPRSPGTPILMLSDIHYGEVVSFEETLKSNQFNIALCEQRIGQVISTTLDLLFSHLANPDYPGLVVVLGGDMISGSLHEDHAVTDEVTPLEQVLGIARLLADSLLSLSAEFKNVTVYCVPGNHGRTTRKPRSKFYAQTNLDWLAYQMIREHLRGVENIEVIAPPVRDMTFHVAGRRYRLTHGDQFRGGDGIIGPIGPIMRGDTRKRMAAGLMPGNTQEYDTMLCGHFHTLLQLPRLIVNGSIKGYDEYALAINVPFELPQQALWTVHPKYGHTWQMPVLCNNGNPTYEEIRNA